MLLRHLSSEVALREPPQDSHGAGKGSASGVDLVAQPDPAKAEFLSRVGDAYGYDGRIDELYAKEIAPRFGPHEHYLDYTGSGLYWNSQIAELEKELSLTAFGNPHSITPSSARASQAVEEVRADLLALFGADPSEYELVFTRSATGALQLVGEMFPWSAGSQYAYLQGNHKSVLGIREYAKRHGTRFASLSEAQAEAWVHEPAAQAAPGLAHCAGSDGQPVFNLFAYPSYDNFSGEMHPVEWVKQVQAKSTPGCQWKVLLDTAAYAPCHPINLSQIQADFICISFYKLFGHPTGVGCLLMKRDMADVMRKIYWGGGSAKVTMSSADWEVLSDGPERFEDGTLPFLDIVALRHGLRVFRSLGGLQAIERHVSSLGHYLYEQAAALRHSNGAPLLEVYGKHGRPDSAARQGATLTFNLLDPSGEYLSWLSAAQQLSAAGLHVRSGCMCNPGAYCAALGVSEQEVMQLAQQKGPSGAPFPWEWIVLPRPVAGSGPRLLRLPLGALRASLGFMSRYEDVAALLHFLDTNYKNVPANATTGPEDVVVVAVEPSSRPKAGKLYPGDAAEAAAALGDAACATGLGGSCSAAVCGRAVGSTWSHSRAAAALLVLASLALAFLRKH